MSRLSLPSISVLPHYYSFLDVIYADIMSYYVVWGYVWRYLDVIWTYDTRLIFHENESAQRKKKQQRTLMACPGVSRVSDNAV